MAVLFECNCIGKDEDRYCSEHGKPIDSQRKLMICRAKDCNHGRTLSTMNEEYCDKCNGCGYKVVAIKKKKS